MNAQLQDVVDEFDRAQKRLHALAASTSEDRWSARPAEGRWSAGECVAHLNLTSAAMLPLLRAALDEARALGEPAPGRYRRDVKGWLLWLGSGARVRIPVKTSAPFVPGGAAPRDETLAEFDRLQEQQVNLVREADGLPLGKVKVVSPFDARVSYNAYAALTILSVHQLRHVAQAERAAAGHSG
jgi:hypothetical protein